MNQTNPLPQLLRLIDVTSMTRLSKSTIYRLQAAGQFPKAIVLTERTVAWCAAEVEAWMGSRRAARDALQLGNGIG